VAGFDGFAALGLAKERCPQVPFIFVSGSNDQAMIIEMFERGAADYVFKLHLQDLAPAVRAALARTPDATDKPRATAPASALKPTTRVPVREKSPSPQPVGPLAFCSQCNRVRTPDGQWTPIADYLALRSAMNITQSVCPQCAPASRRAKG
jgi:DNA-binding response OmpR family regulator